MGLIGIPVNRQRSTQAVSNLMSPGHIHTMRPYELRFDPSAQGRRAKLVPRDEVICPKPQVCKRQPGSKARHEGIFCCCSPLNGGSYPAPVQSAAVNVPGCHHGGEGAQSQFCVMRLKSGESKQKTLRACANRECAKVCGLLCRILRAIRNCRKLALFPYRMH